MQRYHVRCPLCGARVPLFGDEPNEPFPDIECDQCGIGFFYSKEDLIPDRPTRGVNRIDEHPADFQDGEDLNHD